MSKDTSTETKPKRKVGNYEWRGENSVRLKFSHKGERFSKTVDGIKDDVAAETALALFVADVKRGKFKKPSKMTMKELSVRFLRDYAKISPETRESYKEYIDGHINPVFEKNLVDKVRPKHIYDFLSNLKEDGVRRDGKPGGLSPATIQKIFHVLSSMMSFAVELEEIEENPCSHVTPPPIPERDKASVDREVARKLLRDLANESLKWKCIALLAMTAGDRKGEVLGVGDSTLDLDNFIIYVYRAAKRRKGSSRALGSPKTKRSRRAQPFHPSIAPLLREMVVARNKQRDKCGDKWHHKIEVNGEMVDNDLLFTQWNGKPMHPNSVNTWFRKFKKENDLPDYLTFHGLRHTNITQLLREGLSVAQAADNSGHAKRATTLDYADPDAEALREVAEKAGTAFDLENIVPDLLNKPVNVRKKKAEEKQENPPETGE